VHRFYIPELPDGADEVALPDAEAHHALQVLRLRAGDPLTALNGAGVEWRGELVPKSPRAALLRVLERRRHPAPRTGLTLFQAVAKPRAMEWIVQKATELGARQLVPVLTERSVIRLDAAMAEDKRRKWLAVAIEALKQCGQPWLPQIHSPAPLAATIARQPVSELELIASLAPGSTPLRRHFTGFRQAQGRPPRTAAVWIGPEGDFTPAETEAIIARGTFPITLGPSTLRTETAALCALSILRYELEDEPDPGS
jgi:16S rRNA (uracil1498-N3)-methyltransferase